MLTYQDGGEEWAEKGCRGPGRMEPAFSPDSRHSRPAEMQRASTAKFWYLTQISWNFCGVE